MQPLIQRIHTLQQKVPNLPFAVYSAWQEQKLLNVPIVNPVLIFVLNGAKSFGVGEDMQCASGSFVMLPGNAAVNMRNIPKQAGYYAVLLEFTYDDFADLDVVNTPKPNMVIGEMGPALNGWLSQFIDYLAWAPEVMWQQRKREVLALLVQLGFSEVLALRKAPHLSQEIHNLFVQGGLADISVPFLCGQLAMSESSLRRKLKAEGRSLTDIRDNARMGMGLHLLQTTNDSIQRVAEQCGYQSQSRFTDRFKRHFGLTPSELRKTRVAESG